MGDVGMTEKEQATILMDKFIDLQRIKVAEDREKEIEYQLKVTKAKLEALGIVTTDLNIVSEQENSLCSLDKMGTQAL